jgi:isopenicillin N synthase-like dioxygenase
MPSSTKQYPEFPSDVSIADIPILSLTKLEKQNDQESKKLFEACTEHGFFLLDLANSEEGGKLLKNAQEMFDIGAETFALGPENLQQYAYKAPSLIG